MGKYLKRIQWSADRRL